MSEAVSRKNKLRESEDYKKTKKLLFGMVQNVPKMGVHGHLEAEIFEKNRLELHEKWKEAQKVSEILRGLKSEVEYGGPKQKSMSKMLAYLGLVESLGVTLMDMILMVLIINGKEVHTRGPRIRHVRFFKELGELGLEYKLEFLETEGFEVFKSFINKDVRNHIGHLKFTIENNGDIRKKDRTRTRIHIDNEIFRFWKGADTLKLVLEDMGFLKWFGIRERR